MEAALASGDRDCLIRGRDPDGHSHTAVRGEARRQSSLDLGVLPRSDELVGSVSGRAVVDFPGDEEGFVLRGRVAGPWGAGARGCDEEG